MAHSDTAHLGGWRAFLVQTGLLVVGSLSVLILFSFGGQLVVAPALLPAQWIIARDTYGWVSKTFSVLGALLLAEVTYLIFALVFGEVLVTVVIGVPVALAAGLGFYLTSHRANQRR